MSTPASSPDVPIWQALAKATQSTAPRRTTHRSPSPPSLSRNEQQETFHTPQVYPFFPSIYEKQRPPFLATQPPTPWKNRIPIPRGTLVPSPLSRNAVSQSIEATPSIKTTHSPTNESLSVKTEMSERGDEHDESHGGSQAPVSTHEGQDNESYGAAEVYLMPMRSERRAPSFNGQGPHLRNFFNDFETVALGHRLTEDDWITKCLDYVAVDEFELWNRVAMEGGTWTAFKTRIASFYASADDNRTHTIRDLETLTEKFAEKSAVTSADFSTFYRKFYMMVAYLQSKSRLSAGEAYRLLMNSFNPTLRRALRTQLQLTDPNHHPDDAWTIAQVVKAIQIVIASQPDEAVGATASVSTAHSTPLHLPLPEPAAIQPRPTTSVSNLHYAQASTPQPAAMVTQETVARMSAQFEAAIAALVNRVETMAVSNSGGGSNGGSTGAQRGQRFEGCVWCGGEDGHWSRECNKREEYLRRGLVRRNSTGSIVLPNGDNIGRASRRASLCDLVDEWHAQNQHTQRQAPSTTPATGSNATPLGESSSVRVSLNAVCLNSSTVKHTEPASEPKPASATLVYKRPDHLAQQACTYLSAERGEYEAEAPSANPYDGQISADDIPLYEALQHATTLKLEAGRRVAGREAPPVTRSMAQKQGEATKEKTPEASKSSNKGGRLDEGNAEAGAQYHHTTGIERGVDLTGILDRGLSSSVAITMRKLLGIAPGVRKMLKELVVTKRAAAEATVLSVAVNSHFVNTSSSDAPRRAVETLLAALPPPPRGLKVGRHVETIRTIDVRLNNSVNVDAIVDEGSQIVGLNSKVWAKLGIPARADHLMEMEAANASKSFTQGLLSHLKVTVGGCDFYLQVQVVENASYNMLLGRPFHVLAEAGEKHFANGAATLTLTDPNTGAVVTVPTKARGKAQDVAVASMVGVGTSDF